MEHFQFSSMLLVLLLAPGSGLLRALPGVGRAFAEPREVKDTVNISDMYILRKHPFIFLQGWRSDDEQRPVQLCLSVPGRIEDEPQAQVQRVVVN